MGSEIIQYYEVTGSLYVYPLEVACDAMRYNENGIGEYILCVETTRDLTGESVIKRGDKTEFRKWRLEYQPEDIGDGQ